MGIARLLSPLNLASALIALNFVTFAAFGIDKAKAERGAWRTSEATLLWLAIWGGTPGAYAGRHAFRQKTRKQPFVRILHSISLLQVVLLSGAVAWWHFAPHRAIRLPSHSQASRGQDRYPAFHPSPA